MATQMQVKRGSEAQWEATTFILADGQLGYAEDTHTLKIGDGFSLWPALPDLHITDPDVNYLYVQTTDFTNRASTTVLADDPYLSIPISVGSEYIFETSLFYKGAASGGGLKVGLDVPDNCVVSFHSMGDDSPAVSNDHGVLTSSLSFTTSGPTTVVSVVIKGLVNAVSAASDGNLTIAWAQDISNATPTTILGSSFMEVHRII